MTGAGGDALEDGFDGSPTAAQHHQGAGRMFRCDRGWARSGQKGGGAGQFLLRVLPDAGLVVFDAQDADRQNKSAVMRRAGSSFLRSPESGMAGTLLRLTLATASKKLRASVLRLPAKAPQEKKRI